MWLLSAPNARLTHSARSPRGTFRPRVEALEDRCLMSAGALDLSFGSGGLVSGPIGVIQSSTGFTLPRTSWYHVPVVVYPNTGAHPDTDNKILAGGYIDDAVTGYQDFAIARYNSDGTLDTTFGNNGVAATAVGVTSSELYALTLQTDGKVVAVGAAAYQRIQIGRGRNATFFDDPGIAVVRFNADGSLDTSFNAAGPKRGTIVTNISAASPGTSTDAGDEYATATAIDTHGNIVVGATSFPSKGGNAQFSLLRYAATGALDPTFGKGGIVVTPNFGNAWDNADALTIQPDGSILLAGSVGVSGMAVARYKGTNGSLDTSFNSVGTRPGVVFGLLPSGYRESDAYGIVQNNGAIVLAGTSYDSSSGHLTLARISSTGQIDTAFGGSQTGFYVNTNVTSAFSLVQAPNGDLLTGGTYGNGSSTSGLFGVSAALPDGTPDTTFGISGTSTTTGLSGGYARGRGIALQSDGKIVAAGFTPSSYYTLALARFLPPDTRIGSFTASSYSFTAGTLLTLSVSGILNSNPSSTIAGIVFYLDGVGGTPLAVTLVSNTNGTWTDSFDTTGLASGTHTLYAQAVDSTGVVSDPVTVSLQVN